MQSPTIKAYLVKAHPKEKTGIYDILYGYDIIKEEFSIQPFRQLVVPDKAVIGHFIPHGYTYLLSEKPVFYTTEENEIKKYLSYIKHKKLTIVRQGNIPRGYLEALIDNVRDITEIQDLVKQKPQEQLRDKIKDLKDAENNQMEEMFRFLKQINRKR